ncbi:GPP34 family phosphoprotein [Plantactinospora siamensis]|uniref:GPP34 family phosphoprotein n=1 Tax=Plantactinospora siamensis TaxID=555372 RepID=A0ABV6P7I8_9ACTN
MHPLADDYFRLAHRDSTGRSRLNMRAMGVGLAAALLAELVWIPKIALRDGLVCVTDRTPPEDVLAHGVLDQLVAEPRHREVRVWLDVLSRDAYERVAQRLWRAGHVRRVTGRRLLRSSVTWVPTDMTAAYLPWWRLSTLLSEQRPMDHGDAFLAGLAVSTGLDGELLQDAPVAARRYASQLVVTAWPPLRELLVHTQAAVGDAVLLYRT